jgi:membrane-associated phospholipid phosphatase
VNVFDDFLMPILNRGAANGALDWVMPRVTNLHQIKLVLAAVLALCAFVLWRGSRRAKIAVLCSLIAVGLCELTSSRVIKKIVPRDRPCRVSPISGYPAYHEVRLAPGTHCPGSPSLPSNHAANMMAVAVVSFWFTRGRKRWLWFLLPVVIGYSRIYLGFHYPTDILCGWLLGAAAGSLVIFVARSRIEPRAAVGPTDAEASEREASNPVDA